MKRVFSVAFLLTLLVVSLGWAVSRGVAAQGELSRPAGVAHEPAGVFHPKTFVHQATAENIVDDLTLIDHPYTNNNPDAILLVTQNWNPAWAGDGTYNNHDVGVFYDSIEQKWAIYNEDNTVMTEGAAFNILIPNPVFNVFVHTTTAENNALNWTNLDHPVTNGNPEAIVFATHNYNPPGGGSGEYHDHSLGVWYSKSSRWAIFNQDIATMAEGVGFNVWATTAYSSTDLAVFVHTANVTNTVLNWTELDHPLANGNPAAHIIVTQNWSVNGVYNDKAIGVWYDDDDGIWGIFNQDESAMPLGAAFNVRISSRYLYLPMIQYDEANVTQP
jgi:hypothetical protein